MRVALGCSVQCVSLNHVIIYIYLEREKERLSIFIKNSNQNKNILCENINTHLWDSAGDSTPPVWGWVLSRTGCGESIWFSVVYYWESSGSQEAHQKGAETAAGVSCSLASSNTQDNQAKAGERWVECARVDIERSVGRRCCRPQTASCFTRGCTALGGAAEMCGSCAANSGEHTSRDLERGRGDLQRAMCARTVRC